MSHYVTKAPAEVKDFRIDWTDALGDDTIDQSTWESETGLTIGPTSSSHTTTSATVWLSGGTDAHVYIVTNTITTAGGRTFEDTLTVTVAQP
jgi:hypothetical protein